MQTAIKVEQLSEAYDNLLTVNRINLSVKCGTACGPLGADGAGKNTTIEYISGTKNADNGTASVLNCNPQKDRCHLSREVDVQFQKGDYQPEIKVSELCGETACLYGAPADWKSFREQSGIDGKIGNAVKGLSGGERQRLLTMLASIPNPDLVLPDELTIRLDVKAHRNVWEILRELKQGGPTTFLASHFTDEVETLCDKVCISKQGKAVFHGTVEQAKVVGGYEKFEDAYFALSGEEVGE